VIADRSERQLGLRSLVGVEVDAVIFDLDGTLFDHQGAARDGAAAWLCHLGHAPTEELISRWFEAEERFFAAWHRGALDWQGQRRARIREMLGHLELAVGDDAALDANFAVYLAAYEQAWRAFDDATPALEALAAVRLPAAVLTNGTQAQQHAKLSACGLADLTTGLFSSDSIGFAKPDPRAFLHVCDVLELPPTRVLHVGDRHDLDVVAARDAGLLAIHLDRTDPRLPLSTGQITSLRDLPGRLGLVTLID
jgi:putative hydrolase of the HAD superfamily